MKHYTFQSTWLCKILHEIEVTLKKNEPKYLRNI